MGVPGCMCALIHGRVNTSLIVVQSSLPPGRSRQKGQSRAGIHTAQRARSLGTLGAG